MKTYWSKYPLHFRKLLKERDKEKPFQEAKRIVHQDSSAYLDFVEEVDEVTIEFFSYQDKGQIGTGPAFKALKILCDSFLNQKQYVVGSAS